MTTTIEFTYTNTSKQETLEKLQRECKVMMETIEALEEMRGTVAEDELNEAIEEANRELESIEHEITSIIWNN